MSFLEWQPLATEFSKAKDSKTTLDWGFENLVTYNASKIQACSLTLKKYSISPIWVINVCITKISSNL